VTATWASQLLTQHRKHGPNPAQVRAAMDARLAETDNAVHYARRKITVEPVFGQIKTNRGYRQFQRRGLNAVNSEWKLICASHNLLKLWRHRPAPGPA
jgi:hypothetical protein